MNVKRCHSNKPVTEFNTMGCLRNMRACLTSVGWLKSTSFLLTLGSLYVAALSTFVAVATGALPEILLKQPLQNPSDPPTDLTKSPACVGTLKELQHDVT